MEKKLKLKDPNELLQPTKDSTNMSETPIKKLIS